MSPQQKQSRLKKISLQLDVRKFKPKRKRMTDYQTMKLTEAFDKSSKPNTSMRLNLAMELGLTVRAVQIWFQNKRARQKTLMSQEQDGLVDSSGMGTNSAHTTGLGTVGDVNSSLYSTLMLNVHTQLKPSANCNTLPLSLSTYPTMTTCFSTATLPSLSSHSTLPSLTLNSLSSLTLNNHPSLSSLPTTDALFRSPETLFKLNESLFKSHETLLKSNETLFKSTEPLFRSTDSIQSLVLPWKDIPIQEPCTDRILSTSHSNEKDFDDWSEFIWTPFQNELTNECFMLSKE